MAEVIRLICNYECNDVGAWLPPEKLRLLTFWRVKYKPLRCFLYPVACSSTVLSLKNVSVYPDLPWWLAATGRFTSCLAPRLWDKPQKTQSLSASNGLCLLQWMVGIIAISISEFWSFINLSWFFSPNEMGVRRDWQLRPSEKLISVVFASEWDSWALDQ